MSEKPKILFIDDNPVDRTLIERVLTKQGFYVFLAEDAQSGLLLAQQHAPDLILLDILLPKISGIEVCKKLRHTPSTEHIPIIFYTSIDTPKHLIDYASYGACDYLQKTMPAEMLVSAIQAALKNNSPFK